MSIPFYAKSERNQGYIKNLEVVGFSDLNGINAFQMALYKTGEKYYLYCGSFKGAGVNILDVTDPAKPEVVGCVYVSDPKVYFAQSTPKVQVADGLLIVALGGGVPFLHGIKAGDPALGGLQILQLPGHSMDMIGVRTPDNVVFLADCVFSEETTQKYHVNFQYDVAKAFQTLDYVEMLEADLFVPAHAAPCRDIQPLVQANRAKMQEVADLLLALCKGGACFEDILAEVFTHYSLEMNVGQHALVGSTVRSYLSYLADAGKITLNIDKNRLIFETV